MEVHKSHEVYFWGRSFEFCRCLRGVIWMIKIGAIQDATPPHPPPPPFAIAPQTINKTFSIKMLKHEDGKHSFKANLLVFIFVFAFSQRLKYLTSATNLIEWAIYVSALYYVFPVCACKSYFKTMAAAFSLFFAWLNLVLYFRRLVIPFFSITPHAANTR